MLLQLMVMMDGVLFIQVKPALSLHQIHYDSVKFQYYHFYKLNRLCAFQQVIANFGKLYLMHSQKGVDIKTLPQVRAGQIHYSRIPVEYWEHRILMVKALGLNALSVYIMWNYHELQKGLFDYSTQNKNLPYFLELAQKHGLMVLFRPGPYVCAEWDFGGFPARLLNIPNIQFRANNKSYLEETKIYFQSLVPIIRKHLRTQSNPKGCIVMLQIENEYGFYGTDQSYMTSLRNIWYALDVHIAQYYVDWIQNIHKCHWEGANIGINDWNRQQQLHIVREFEKNGMILGGEIYSGWMTHWGQRWGGKKIQKVLADYQYLMSHQYSFSMYMVHGGTNFGLTSGANDPRDKQTTYWGDVTSYDYDAPINQQGSSTPKYLALRELFQRHLKQQFIQIPKAINMINIQQIVLKPKGNLFDNLPFNTVVHEKPLLFQSNELKMFNQGIVLYTNKLQNNSHYQWKVVAHDYGLLYLGNKLLHVLDRSKETHYNVTITEQMINNHGSTLSIVVQALGHINFDKSMYTDFKGLFEFSSIKQQIGLQQWTMHSLNIQYQILKGWKPQGEQSSQYDFPRVFTGQFSLNETGDTYLDLSNYEKGYVWVNGRNLGRYWSVGPQQRLFCPGVWLKSGINQITIFNLNGKGGSNIKGVKNLYDGPLQFDD